jgi:hypothetical protein
VQHMCFCCDLCLCNFDKHMTKILVKLLFLLRWKILENQTWKIQSCIKQMSLYYKILR